VIKIENLRFSYEKSMLFDGIDAQFEKGCLSALIGPNGAGKSTLLKIISGFLKPMEGKILLSGKEKRQFTRQELARLLAYVPQNNEPDVGFRVEKIVLMGRYPYRGFREEGSASDREAVERALALVDAEQLRGRNFSELSGGEKQRVILASALAQEPKILLLDEPASYLDIYHQLHLYEILTRLAREEGLTILTVTHNINMALRYAEKIAVMEKGKIVFKETPEKLIESGVISKVFAVEGEYYYPRNGAGGCFIPLQLNGEGE
jgi:iron complex transport system ATP-binding protein